MAFFSNIFKWKVIILLRKPPAEGSLLGAVAYVYQKILPPSETEKTRALLTLLSVLINGNKYK